MSWRFLIWDVDCLPCSLTFCISLQVVFSAKEEDTLPMARFDVPGFDVPGVDVPGVDVPGVDVPGVDVPEVDVPEVGCSWS